jgi:hypothetical protein
MTSERAAELLKRCDHIDEWRRMRPETPWKAGIDPADLRDLLAALAEALALLRRWQWMADNLNSLREHEFPLKCDTTDYLTRHDAERQSGETPEGSKG